MAIAFDAASNGRDNGVTSLTFSHTCSGSDRGLMVCVVGDIVDKITGVTYAGEALSLIGKTPAAGTSRFCYAYYRSAPATGINNVVVSAPSSSFIEGNAASYTGVSQTGQPEAFVVNAGANGTSLTSSVTTLTNNAWAVICAAGIAGSIAAGASTTLRQSNLVGAVLDSGGAVTPAGSRSLIFTIASTAEMGGIICSLAEASGGGGSDTVISATTGAAVGALLSSSPGVTGIAAITGTAVGALLSANAGATAITAATGAVVVALSSSSAVTFVSEPLRDNTGTLVVNKALNHVALYNDTTGVLVVRKTGLSTDASGVFSFTDGSLVSGTTYRVDWEDVDGRRRMPRKAV